MLPRPVSLTSLSSLSLLTALVALPLLPADAGAQRQRIEGEYRTRIDTTVAFDRGGVVQLDQIGGDVVVTTWDRPEVRILAYAEHGGIAARITRGRIVLGVQRENGRTRIGESRFEVTVPADVRVKAASIRGSVSVDGVRGDVEASSTNGAVTVRDIEGRTTLASVGGTVTATNVEGGVSASSVSGDVTLRDVDGNVRANTVTGAITLRDVRGRSVVAGTTNGGVTFQGPLDRDGRYEFTSHAGTVSLLLAPDVGADLSIETYSGTLETDFPVTMEPDSRRGARPRSFDVTLGDGGARVVAQSFSGNVLLRRAGSGREP